MTTIKAREAIARKIITECFEDDTPVTKDHKHFEYLHKLIKNIPIYKNPSLNPEQRDLIENTIEFLVRPHNVSAGLILCLRTSEDGEWNTVSWKMGCGGKPPDQLTKVMRDIVFCDQKEFKQQNQHDLICSHCKRSGLEWSDYHADHKVPFKLLKINFLKQYKGKVPTRFKYRMSENYSLYDEDEQFSKDWYDYHKEKVFFQILCKRCNLSKGSKICVCLPV